MNFFEWVMTNPVVSTPIIFALCVIIISIVIMYIIAFFQGREVFFWPPKLGPKIDKPKGENKTDLSKSKTSIPDHELSKSEWRSRDEVAELYAKARENCYWLGILGNRKFIYDIISPEVSDRDILTLLKTSHGLSYSFLFINPFSMSFETRMREENKGNKDLGRVRRTMLELASELFNSVKSIREHSNKIWVGFHNEHLIWNMIVVDETVYLGYYIPNQPGHKRPLITLKPSEELSPNSLNFSFRNYYSYLQTRSLAFDNGEFPIKDVWSKLVRFARQHDRPECDPYNGFRKGNTLVVHPSQQHVTKFFVSPRNSVAEAIGIETFSSQAQIPNIEEDFGIAITRRYIEGPRLYDLFITLNKLSNEEFHRNEGLSQKAGMLRDTIVRKNIDWITDFQNYSTQRILEENLGENSAVYAFKHKAIESLEIIKEFTEIDSVYWSDIEREVCNICEYLSDHSDTYLRDANPKNVIVDYKEIVDDRARKEILESSLLEADTDVLKIADGLWKRCFQIDFESVYTKSTKYDDLIHLMVSPSIATASEAINRISISPLFAENDYKVIWHTLFFRSLRSFGRRVYYRHNESSLIYNSRYRDENYNHFALLGAEAIAKLVMSEPQYMILRKFWEDIIEKI